MNKKILLILACGVLSFNLASAQTVTEKNASVTKNGNNVDVKVDLNVDKGIKTNKAMVLTPILYNGADSVSFPSVVVYGRNRYYYNLRKNGEAMMTGTDEQTVKYNDLPRTINYSATTPYEKWMEGCNLLVRKQVYGCCNDKESSEDDVVSRDNKFTKTPLKDLLGFVYVTPEPEEVKSRAVEGEAYIIFPVNKTTIDESVADNRTELRKITSSLDSVRSDKYATIKSVSIKGYASPEGKYAANERLAKARTEAVKNYVDKIYDLDDDVLKTDYVAENWEGFREYVENSSLENKQAILDIMDSDLDLDAKDWRIKLHYPNDYKTILSDCYPSLRKTDYKIDYVIRKIDDVEEIQSLVKTRPQELSLNEFYIAAQNYEPGSEDFNEVFDVAVRQYPNDEVANLNAANASLSEGNINAAKKYLKKAGDSAEAEYARGMLAVYELNYDDAKEHFTNAKNGGVKEAAEALEKLADYME